MSRSLQQASAEHESVRVEGERDNLGYCLAERLEPEDPPSTALQGPVDRDTSGARTKGAWGWLWP